MGNPWEKPETHLMDRSQLLPLGINFALVPADVATLEERNGEAPTLTGWWFEDL